MAPADERPEPRNYRGLALARFNNWLIRRLSRTTASGEFIPEVDGLRFIAIAAVILHHVIAFYLRTTQQLGLVDLPVQWWDVFPRSDVDAWADETMRSPNDESAKSRSPNNESSDPANSESGSNRRIPWQRASSPSRRRGGFAPLSVLRRALMSLGLVAGCLVAYGSGEGTGDAGAGGFSGTDGEPSQATAGASGVAGTGGTSSAGAAAGSSGSTAAAGAGGGPLPELPPVIYVEPEGPVNTSQPDHVVGNGTPASCSETTLRTAVAAGGIITFDCGPAPVTINLSEPLITF